MLRPYSWSLASLLLLAACSSDDDPEASFPDEVAESALAVYKQNVHANYAEAVEAARALDAAIEDFVEEPSAARLQAAKQAWIAARIPYGPSEAYRFYDGPIDDPETGLEGRINAWPLDENEIDYTRDAPNAGLINDTSFQDLSKEAIADQNEKNGEKSITTGWHAIEFLLWGQDDATPGTGPGKRPYTDYVEGGTAENQDRRATYLKNVAALLVEDLDSVRAAWDPTGTDTFAAKFGVEASDPATEPDAKKEAIAKLLRAIGSMAKGELSGERMTVAFKNRSEEDEHSCFSDTTATDMLGNGLGVQNVWLGRYGANDGVGLEDVVAEVDPALAEKTTADIADSVQKLQKLEDLQEAGTPIDVILQAPDDSEGRQAMLAAIQSLKVVAQDVERASTALGLEITLEEASEEL